MLVDIPRLGFYGIAAKVDTGAYFCSLHCHQIEEKEENGKQVLCFMLLDPTHPEYKEKVITFKKFAKKTIKSSFGDTEERYIIRTVVHMHSRRIRTYITLTNRGSMTYPMLIGRRLLKNKFIVDVSLK